MKLRINSVIVKNIKKSVWTREINYLKIRLN